MNNFMIFINEAYEDTVPENEVHDRIAELADNEDFDFTVDVKVSWPLEDAR